MTGVTVSLGLFLVCVGLLALLALYLLCEWWLATCWCRALAHLCLRAHEENKRVQAELDRLVPYAEPIPAGQPEEDF